MDDSEKWAIIRFTSHKTIHPFRQVIFLLVILLFKLSRHYISSAAFNINNSVPQLAATTSAVTSV